SQILYAEITLRRIGFGVVQAQRDFSIQDLAAALTAQGDGERIERQKNGGRHDGLGKFLRLHFGRKLALGREVIVCGAAACNEQYQNEQNGVENAHGTWVSER